MKVQKRLAFFILILLALGILLVKPGRFFQKPPDSLLTTDQDSVEAIIGLYDRQHQLGNLSVISIKHRYVTLAKSGPDLTEDLSSSKKPQLITLFLANSSPENCLEDLLAGDYNAAIQTLCTTLSRTGQPVYLRWCPEMEVPVHRAISKAPNIKRVWGPVGDRGSMEWWPGADVVDYISIAIYGLPDKNITDRLGIISKAEPQLSDITLNRIT
ncbi:hypothetical protein ACO2Q8_17735 [Larkinella sp. VNQ87]|uniref:hypothetical protein n=1 Tax=Larkinella sp. VNQ87 TaxID=3400921 RepID=UPI003C088037